MTTKKWYLLMTVAAFISVISFFQINSFWADNHKFNGIAGWLGIGILFGLVAIYCLIMVNKKGGTSSNRQ